MYTATSNEKVMELLNTWYIEMRARRIGNAQRLKEKIDIKIQKLKMKKKKRYKIKIYCCIILYWISDTTT